ncbi:MAG TPA: L-histidine N(alpha)-methyltransferase [Burkholderiales bacterium]|nr:L-histidine N(alpha)-methyltransferase [Burkholderiales bacterium]
MASHTKRLSFHDIRPAPASMRAEIIDGLSRPNKAIAPKYFYDDRGSRLFEEICDLPEYYPTRTELDLMRRHGGEMARALGGNCLLIEYGSGSGRKTRLLIDALQPAAYVPIDIAGEQLEASAAEFAAAYPALEVIAVCADYSRPLDLPLNGLRTARRAIYFPGSTIGNLSVAEAGTFLRNAARLAGPGGAMLVGVDLKKDEGLLNAAYNDSRGVTAAFNLNLLARINRELDADFDLDAFRHRAFYNADAGRVEMHLVSLKAQRVTIGGQSFEFGDGETIHTENSCKYTVDEFRNLARSAGFEPRQVWTDANDWFSVHYLMVPA